MAFEADSTDPSGKTRAALLDSLTLLGAASAAARILRAVRERRSGGDPSDQEALHDAREHLRRSIAALQELVYPLLLSLVVHSEGPDEGTGQLVRRFDEQHRLVEIGEELRRIHQRLMSLYPAVDERLIEEARLLQAQVTEEPLDIPLDESNSLVARLEDVLRLSLRLEHVVDGLFSA